MEKLTVEVEIFAIEQREDEVAVVFLSDRQAKTFAINFKGEASLKPGDRVVVEVKPKKKRAKKSEV